MEMNLGNVTLGTIIAIFVGVVVVMGIIPAIADNTGIMTTKSTTTDEAIDLSTAWSAGQHGVNSTLAVFTIEDEPTGWKTTGCPITNFVYGNSSVDFTLTTDYTFVASTGVLTVNPTAVVNNSGNDTLVDYTWCRDGYTTGATQSIVNLILIFAGLAIVAYIIFYLFKR